MTHLTKALAVATGLALSALATAASAATLTIAGGTEISVPRNYDPKPHVSVPGREFTLFKSKTDGGVIGGGLMLDRAAMVTYTFRGKEAAATNSLGSLGLTNATLFDNHARAGTSATVRDDGGFVDFLFRTSGLGPKGAPAIFNGTVSQDKRLGLVFSDVFNEGRSVIAAFGDGRGDNDFDDLVVQIDVAPVPVPAAGVLLVGALGAMGALRRRRRA